MANALTSHLKLTRTGKNPAHPRAEPAPPKPVGRAAAGRSGAQPHTEGKPQKTAPKLPSIFIVGTMKGGTTALYDHMCTHPKIVGGAAKEIHYFSLFPDRGADWYAEQFAQVPEDCLTIDASPTYFDMCFGRGIPAMINAQVPDARVFLIVRDPIARAVSHFYHLKKVIAAPALENISADEFFSRPFEGAIAQATHLDIFLFQVLSFSGYLPKYWTYRSIFGDDRLMVLSNDALRDDPAATMRKAYGHVGLDYHSDDTFGAFRHSNGSSIDHLSGANIRRLADLLYPGYQKLCTATGLQFTPLDSTAGDAGIPRPVPPVPVENADPTLHAGRDGWLFLTGGNNRPIDLFNAKTTPFTDRTLQAWRKLVLSRDARARELGARYIHLVAPEKLSVYPEYCTLPLDPTLRPGNRLREQPDLADIVLDPVLYYQRYKPETKLYWKTDTHWTYHGCYAAYQLLMARLGLAFDPDLLNRPYNEGPITFDLGGKLDPPCRETARFYRPIRDAVRIHANELVEFQESQKRFSEIELHVGTQVIYRNDVNPVNDKTLVLFGDSFSEYRPSLLTGLLAESFREVHFLWTANLDFDYVEQVRPDFVVTESAERFMNRVPTDDVNFDQFVRDRLRHLKIAG